MQRRRLVPFALVGEQQGAMAGLAMILAGILTAVFAPLAVWLLGLG
ncbi:MAG: LrgB family protein [Solidesulfovibrio sp. DCME]